MSLRTARRRLPTAVLDTIRARTNLPALIGRVVKLKRAGRGYTGLCPFHSEKTPSFSVYQNGYHCFGCGAHGDAFAWVQHCTGGTFREAVNTLAEDTGMEMPFPDDDAFELPKSAPPPEVALSEVDDAAAMQRNQDFARRLWSEALPAPGTLVETYLASRCIWMTPEASRLRFHPACPRKGERLPAMVALMVDPLTFAPVGVHRTFLRRDGSGKADGVAKMMLGKAGVICFDREDDEGGALGIAEGIETTLSVQQHVARMPMWACGSAGGIESLPHRPTIGLLRIFPDNDESKRGWSAAQTCGERWQAAGTSVRISMPRHHEDWNDAVVQERQW